MLSWQHDDWLCPDRYFDWSRVWTPAWSCAVLFSDNMADFAALKQLTEQRSALAARRDEMEACFSANARACQVCCCSWPAAFLGCRRPACSTTSMQELMKGLGLKTKFGLLLRHAMRITQALQHGGHHRIRCAWHQDSVW